MFVILKNTKMENNQVEWIMVKKITSKENRKNIRKLIFQGILFFCLSYAFMIFMMETMIWFWNSEILESSAQYLRLWVK
jgi:hypothetical protein